MAVECPVDDCSFTGLLDAVEGHIGGVAEGHGGVVPADVRKSLDGEGSEGVPGGLVVLVVLALLIWYFPPPEDEGESGTGESEASQGVEAGGLW